MNTFDIFNSADETSTDFFGETEDNTVEEQQQETFVEEDPLNDEDQWKEDETSVFKEDETFEFLDVSDEDVEALQEKAKDVERSEHKKEISFGKKMCPTRHGCEGATYCDACGSDYPG